jgi:hypothetical protein
MLLSQVDIISDSVTASLLKGPMYAFKCVSEVNI